MNPSSVCESIRRRAADFFLVRHQNRVRAISISNNATSLLCGIDDAIFECEQWTDPPASLSVSNYNHALLTLVQPTPRG